MLQKWWKSEFVGFEWDEEKCEKNLGKHGIDFMDAAKALLEPHLTHTIKRSGESRVVALADVEDRIIAVIYTIRNGHCRIISARAARRNERKAYHQVFG